MPADCEATQVTSLGGQAFTLVGKSASTFSDLYGATLSILFPHVVVLMQPEDAVSKYLKVSTQSMTWCCGYSSNCCMPSFCASSPVSSPSKVLLIHALSKLPILPPASKEGVKLPLLLAHHPTTHLFQVSQLHQSLQPREVCFGLTVLTR